MKTKVVDVVDAMIRGLVVNEVNPLDILIGIHNAFVHGEILKEAGLTLDEGDKNLGKLFHGFDISMEAMKQIMVDSGY
jgi:hypothetical protein